MINMSHYISNSKQTQFQGQPDEVFRRTACVTMFSSIVTFELWNLWA